MASHELAAQVNQALRNIVLLLRRASADAVVSAPQFSVLGSLEHTSRRMSELAKEHGVRLPTMTVQINRLERAGFVLRQRGDVDARVVTVVLTPEGLAALRDGRDKRIDFLSQQLANLDESDRAAIEAAVPALTRLCKGDTSS